MLKRILAASLAAFMIFAVGCSDDDVAFENLSNYENSATDKTKTDANSEATAEDETVELFLNPLTGVKDLKSEEQTKQRPVAIMVENSTIAMPVQTSLSKADIIYETEVEGGITRLLAVYQDISELDKIGNVRSARYPYVDLALGHNAIYIHCGTDPTYCKPHLNDIDDIDINNDTKENMFGWNRFSNGLSDTHNVYVVAKDILSRISKNFELKKDDIKPWAQFSDTDTSLGGASATSVSVPFPASTTRFTYDQQSGLYTRLIGSNVQTDYFTKEKTQVKNIFILMTSISYYPDGEHRKVAFESGKGYYITNGTMQEIKWSKGAASNKFKFTDVNGAEIEISAGNSWVCIANKNTCKPVIK